MIAPDPPGNEPSRLEREVMEILEQADRDPTAAEVARSHARDAKFRAQQTVQESRRSLAMVASDGALLVISILLGVLALLLRHGQPRVAQVFGVMAAVVIIFVVIRGATRRKRGPSSGPRHDGTTWSHRLRDRRPPRG